MEVWKLLLWFIPMIQAMFDGPLEERFHYYEKLEPTAVTHHMDKRAADMDGVHERVVSISALGEHFRLHLHSKQGLFAPDFHTITVSSQDIEEEVFFDRRDFYTGYVEGFEGSTVNAHWQGSSLSAVIHTTQDTFVIEPSWGHIKDSQKYTMIAYRFSDMKLKAEHDLGDHYCGLVDTNGTDHAAYNILAPNHIQDFDESLDVNRKPSPDDVKDRYKRQSNKRTHCPVALVADYRFYDVLGRSDVSTTVKALVSIMAEVDDIFRKSDFGDGLKYGFEIKRVVIHMEPTNTEGHYNQQTSSWETSALLEAFSSEPWDTVCLAHLFTYLSFDNGVLGLAWVASSKPNDVGGICTLKSGGKYYNTGWSSSVNAGGDRLTTVEAYLVTAHEFGHNWGSPHDPYTSSCAPDSGKYLMYTYAVSGKDDNNFKFSKCSRNTIETVLGVRKDDCFVQEGSTAFCGNYIVENGEECDPGFDLEGDPCCTSNCNLRTGARCSDLNQLCCFECNAAPTDTVCREVENLIGSCELNTNCDGRSYECPTDINPKPAGTACTQSGECDGQGNCQSVCELNNRIDCLCDNEDDACKVCCKRDSDSSCSPYPHNGGTLDMSDGTPCYKGYCDDGECNTEVRDLTGRLWDILEDVDSFSGFVKFMRNNIVLSVVVLSLIVYMPFVIVILILDYFRDKEDDDEVDWHHKDNNKLFSPKDMREVRETYARPRRPRRGYSNPGFAEDESLLSGQSRATATGVYVNDRY